MITIGSTAMITLRKMIESSTRISSTVARPTITSAFDEASWESRACAAAPVTPSRRSVSATSGFASERSCFTLSIAGVSKAC